MTINPCTSRFVALCVRNGKKNWTKKKSPWLRATACVYHMYNTRTYDWIWNVWCIGHTLPCTVSKEASRVIDTRMSHIIFNLWKSCSRDSSIMFPVFVFKFLTFYCFSILFFLCFWCNRVHVDTSSFTNIYRVIKVKIYINSSMTYNIPHR